MNRSIRFSLVGLTVLLLPFATLVSGQRGGGSGHAYHGGAQTSVNRGSNMNRNTNINSNRNVNVNSNRNVNVNVHNDVNVHGGYHGGGGYYGGGCCYHPVATAAAVAAASIVTAAVIGSMVNTVPPSCSTVMVNGMTYSQCGNTWYQPQFSGSSTTYVVVNAPR